LFGIGFWTAAERRQINKTKNAAGQRTEAVRNDREASGVQARGRREARQQKAATGRDKAGAAFAFATQAGSGSVLVWPKQSPSK